MKNPESAQYRKTIFIHPVRTLSITAIEETKMHVLYYLFSKLVSSIDGSSNNWSRSLLIVCIGGFISLHFSLFLLHFLIGRVFLYSCF